MVTSEQFVNGIVSYIDNEVMPHLSTAAKWGLGASVVLASQHSTELLGKFVDNDLVKGLGVVTPEGLIDVDTLANALKQSATKYGNLMMDLPFGLGTLTFNANDIDRIRAYIGGQTR